MHNQNITESTTVLKHLFQHASIHTSTITATYMPSSVFFRTGSSLYLAFFHTVFDINNERLSWIQTYHQTPEIYVRGLNI